MAKSPRMIAREQVVEAAQAAQDALSDSGASFAPLDVIKIAADYAARYAVLSAQFGCKDSQQELAEQLRKEFASRLAYWEDHFFNGGERIVVSKDPSRVVLKVEILDALLDEQARKRRNRS